jgi:hypothetical protein
VALTALRCDDPHSSHPDWQAPPGHRASECGRGGAPRRAIEADDAWLACPCEKHWSALHVAYVEAGHLAWLPAPWTTPDVTRTVESIAAAAQLAGEGPVRAAIARDLVAWALDPAGAA